jgi:hypothetical protein
MKRLLMYLHPTIKVPMPMGHLTKYPFNQMVNRIFPDEMNPYPVKLVVPTFHEINALPSHKKTFEEVCLETALGFKKRVNEDIYIKYSGGIDSTSVLVSFMQTWSKEDLERVHIILTHESIKEFPEMWPVIYENFKGRIHNTHADIREYAEKGHVVSGEMGDQLWGSSIMYTLEDSYGIESVFGPWEKTIPRYWYDHHFKGKIEQDSLIKNKSFDEALAHKETSVFLERHNSTLKYCPFPIKTAFDWIWWFNYNNKLHHVLLRDFCWCNLTGLHHRVHAFYNNNDFQRWSLDNHDIKIRNDFVSYKQQAKDFIIKHTGIPQYETKLKVGSAIFLWISKNMARCNFGLDEDYNLWSKEETFEYIKSHSTSK